MVKKGKADGAEMVLKKIRKGSEIEGELKEIEEDIKSNPALGLKETLREMCTRKVLVRSARKKLALASTLVTSYICVPLLLVHTSA